MATIVLNLVTLEVGAKHELLFNKPATALSVTKFMDPSNFILVTVCCGTSWTEMLDKPTSAGLNQETHTEG